MNLPSSLRQNLMYNLFANGCYNHNYGEIESISNIIGYTSIPIDNMIIPAIANGILSIKTDKNIKEYIYSWIYQRGSRIKYKTANSIISNILDKNHIIKIQSSSDETYYGCRGLIMDNLFNPMMMCCYKAHYNYDENKIYYDYPICYINKNIFTYEDLVSKAIIKKIIPFLCTFTVNDDFCISNKPTIIINDKLDNFIHKTKGNVFNSNILWDKLNDY
mgnify:CR=1 FL=1